MTQLFAQATIIGPWTAMMMRIGMYITTPSLPRGAATTLPRKKWRSNSVTAQTAYRESKGRVVAVGLLVEPRDLAMPGTSVPPAVLRMVR